MDDPVALCLGGHTVSSLTGDYESGLAWIDRALRLNQNYADAWMRSSMVRVYFNDLDRAIQHASQAMALSPFDPRLYHPLCAQGYAYLFGGDYAGAVSAARRALWGQQKPEMAYRILVTGLMRLGKTEEALAAARDLILQFPTFRVSVWRARSKFSGDRRLDTMEQALLEANLPA